MPLDEAFDTGTSAALLDMAQRPQAQKPQAPAFSMWATTKAAPKGVVAGAAQGIGSTADVLGAFGDVLGSMGDAGGQGMFGGLTEQERKDSNVAREKLMTEGVNFNSEVGRSFRDVGKDYLPDPVTAHGAEQAVGNLFRLGAKAVAAGALLGPYGGAALAGAEEGFTAADELGQQGVDLGTRTKVGLVKGALTAGAFALPVAGSTWLKTAGLAVAGGPVSFVAENAATRAILENANYSKLADQYDPFDPVGLALSTLLPIGFGAASMRATAKGAKARAAKEAEAAKASYPDPEIVDAARVNMLRENIDSTRLTEPRDLAGVVAHDAAVSRAIDQMAAGERVSVSDIAPADIAARVMDELQPRLEQAMDEIGPTMRAIELPRTDVDAALAGHQSITDKAGERYRITIHEETLGAAKDTQGVFVQVFDPITNQRRARIDFAVNKDGTVAAENTNVAPAYQRRGIAQAMYQAVTDAGYKVVPGRKQTDVGAKMVADLQRKGLIGGEPVVAPKAGPAAPKAAAEPVLKSESPEIDRAVNVLEAERPDMMVQLDGMDTPVRMDDLMRQIREDLGRELQETPLIEVAAACFVS